MENSPRRRAGKVAVPSRWRRTLLGTLIVLAISGVAAGIVIHRMAPPSTSADFSETVRYYQDRIDADPKNADPCLKLGTLAERQGYYTVAVRTLTAARARGAPDDAVAGPLGRSLMHLGRWGEARTELTKASVLAPNSVEALASLTRLYDSIGGAAAAHQLLVAFVQAHPDLVDPAAPIRHEDGMWLLMCFDRLEDHEMALKLAQHLIWQESNNAAGFSVAGKQMMGMGRFAEAAENLEKAAALTPKDASAHLRYGAALDATGRHDEALREWQQAVALDANDLAANRLLGQEYARRSDWADSAEAYAHLAQMSQTAADCRLAGDAYRQAGDRVAADYWHCVGAGLRQDFTTALPLAQAVAQDRRPLWHRRGLLAVATAQHGLKRNADYLRIMREVTASGTSEDLMLLADAYESQLLYNDEIACLRKAADKYPSIAARAYYRMARIHEGEGDEDAAEREAEQAVRLEPANAEYHEGLATVLFRRRDRGDRLKRAIDEYRQVLQQKPNDGPALCTLGVAYEAAGDLKAASALLEHALDVDPGDAATYLALGRICKRMGDTQNGERLLAMYRRFDEQAQTGRIRAARSAPDSDGNAALAAK